MDFLQQGRVLISIDRTNEDLIRNVIYWNGYIVADVIFQDKFLHPLL